MIKKYMAIASASLLLLAGCFDSEDNSNSVSAGDDKNQSAENEGNSSNTPSNSPNDEGPSSGSSNSSGSSGVSPKAFSCLVTSGETWAQMKLEIPNYKGIVQRQENKFDDEIVQSYEESYYGISPFEMTSMCLEYEAEVPKKQWENFKCANGTVSFSKTMASSSDKSIANLVEYFEEECKDYEEDWNNGEYNFAQENAKNPVYPEKKDTTNVKDPGNENSGEDVKDSIPVPDSSEPRDSGNPKECNVKYLSDGISMELVYSNWSYKASIHVYDDGMMEESVFKGNYGDYASRLCESERDYEDPEYYIVSCEDDAVSSRSYPEDEDEEIPSVSELKSYADQACSYMMKGSYSFEEMFF